MESFSEYHEAIEMLVYEKTSTLKLDDETRQSIERPSLIPPQYFATNHKTGEYGVYITRLILIIIGTLCKLATKYRPFASRVILCLAKILR